jgi:hypothetical protein
MKWSDYGVGVSEAGLESTVRHFGSLWETVRRSVADRIDSGESPPGLEPIPMPPWEALTEDQQIAFFMGAAPFSVGLVELAQLLNETWLAQSN